MRTCYFLNEQTWATNLFFFPNIVRVHLEWATSLNLFEFLVFFFGTIYRSHCIFWYYS